MSLIEPPAASDFLRTTLGRTGRPVHRLGVAASFGIGGRDLEAAVEEHGLTYLYWGSFRTRTFAAAIRALCARGLRDRLFIVIQSYSRLGCLVRPSLSWALRRLGIERADMLLLGWWNDAPPPRIIDAAVACRERGLVSHVGLSTHERPLAATLAAPGSPYDVLHVRYNAANRGAEREVFPVVPPRPERAGLVAFTATRWGQLLAPAPAGERRATAGDCYRFALMAPEVDVVVTGPKDGAQLREAIATVQRGPMDPDELAWIRGVGDRVYEGSSVSTTMREKV